MDIEFERAAVQQKEMPDGLRLSEQKAYTALRNIYTAYHRKDISKSVAKSDRDKVIRALITEKSEEDFLNRESEALKNRIDEASKAYKEQPSKENADNLYCAFYGLKKMD